MSIQPLLQDPDSCVMPVASEPILVTITIVGAVPTPSQDPVPIPWLFAGDIVFTIEGDTFQPTGGITFLDPNAPFIVSMTDDKHCVVTAVNDNPALTVNNVGPFHYTLHLVIGGLPEEFDPTVENDSPPPTPIEM